MKIIRRSYKRNLDTNKLEWSYELWNLRFTDEQSPELLWVGYITHKRYLEIKKLCDTIITTRNVNIWNINKEKENKENV
jgi:hypothetical protein